MPDGPHNALSSQLGTAGGGAPSYLPPLALLLDGLGTTELDLARPVARVNAAFLRFLLQEFARTLPFDPVFYARAYPDVEAARLAGEVPTLHEHFVTQGYFERRQPCGIPFDPREYYSGYKDLATAFDPADIYALRAHFMDRGWQEGRAGVSWQRGEAERWLGAARDAGVHVPLSP
jgi:hypothetical protein